MRLAAGLKPPRLVLACGAFGWLACASAGEARATPLPPPNDRVPVGPREPTLGPTRAAVERDSTAASRVAFIQDRLDAGTASARWWWYGWLGGYAAATLAQSAVGLATHDRELRVTMLVGAGGSALGALSVVAMPFPPTSAASELRATKGMPEARRDFLARDSLYRCAEAEELGRSWLPHALGVAVAAAQGLVLWIGFDQPLDGAETAVVSVLVSEAQIFTQPIRAVHDRDSYLRLFSRPRSTALKWRLAPFHRGLALGAPW